MNRIESRIKRHKSFFGSRKPGLLTLLNYKYGPTVPSKLPINEIDWMNPKSVERFAESQYRVFEAINLQHDKEGDDYLPWMGIQVGTGSIGASYLNDAGGVKMHYESITDWMETPFSSWNDLRLIGFNPDNPYFRALFQVTRHLVERCDGSYGIRNYPHFNALDLANQLRGNELFTDIYDEPEAVLEMLRLNNQAIIDLETYVQDNLIKKHSGFGSISGLHIESGVYLSCDAGDMIGPELLKEFGRDQMQVLCNTFGGVFLHHHELGINTVPVWAELSNLTAQQQVRDPNTKHIDDCADEVMIQASLKVPVLFYTSFDKYVKNAEFWSRGRFAVQVDIFDEAQEKEVLRLADKFRSV
jgi:hypothetical protein